MAEPISRNRVVASIGRLLNRLATRWSAPGTGRVAVCSPLVGLIAGLGAVAFLISLDATMRHVLGGLLHFQLPPTGEGTRHPITYPGPWWLIPLIPAVGGLLAGL